MPVEETGKKEADMANTIIGQPRGGWLEVIAGCMFSGKTEELIRRVRRAEIARQKAQVFKPKLDNRHPGSQVASHSGLIAEAEAVETASEILDRVLADTRVVAIDEAQFFDWAIVEVARSLTDRGLRVIVAGLDLDFRAEPFGPMPLLMAEAELVDKLHAICVACGNDASRTQRLVNGWPAMYDQPVVQVGGAEAYEARCRQCYQAPEKPGI